MNYNFFPSSGFFHRVGNFFCSQIWKGVVPPTVDIFCWLAIAGKVSTADNLQWKGTCSKPF